MAKGVGALGYEAMAVVVGGGMGARGNARPARSALFDIAVVIVGIGLGKFERCMTGFNGFCPK